MLHRGSPQGHASDDDLRDAAAARSWAIPRPPLLRAGDALHGAGPHEQPDPAAGDAHELARGVHLAHRGGAPHLLPDEHLAVVRVRHDAQVHAGHRHRGGGGGLRRPGEDGAPGQPGPADQKAQRPRARVQEGDRVPEAARGGAQGHFGVHQLARHVVVAVPDRPAGVLGHLADLSSQTILNPSCSLD